MFVFVGRVLDLMIYDGMVFVILLELMIEGMGMGVLLLIFMYRVVIGDLMILMLGVGSGLGLNMSLFVGVLMSIFWLRLFGNVIVGMLGFGFIVLDLIFRMLFMLMVLK